MNEDLRTIYNEDQKDRKDIADFLSSKPKQSELEKFNKELLRKDRVRLKRVKKIIQEKRLESGNDFLYASMIYQHGGSPEHYAMAHLLAWQAEQLGVKKTEENLPPPLWLAAAARDRWQKSLNLPQDFGTQWERNKDGTFSLYKINPIFSDEKRRKWDVDPPKKDGDSPFNQV